MGMFIANVAYKELILSTSSKSSQKAFFVADSVIECALRHDIRGPGFRIDGGAVAGGTDDRSKTETALNCNGSTFLEEDESVFNEVSANGVEATTVYYVSFGVDSNSDGFVNDLDLYTDANSNGAYDDGEVSLQPQTAYAKLIVHKDRIGTVNDKTILKVFGHNKYSGVGQVERAIEVTY